MTILTVTHRTVSTSSPFLMKLPRGVHVSTGHEELTSITNWVMSDISVDFRSK